MIRESYDEEGFFTVECDNCGAEIVSGESIEEIEKLLNRGG